MAERDENITTSINLDITDLKKNAQAAARQIRLANSAFAESTSAMDDWTKSTEGLNRKLEQLNAIHDAETAKLRYLEAQYRQVVEEQGESSRAAQDLKIKMNNQQAAVNKTQKEIDKYNQKLEEVTAESNRTKTATEKLSDEINDQESTLKDLKKRYSDVVLSQGEASDEAQQLAQQITTLNSDLQANKTKMSDANKAADKLTDSLDDVGNEAEQSSGGFTVMKGALAELIANGISAGINKVGEFVGSLFELSEATKEYRSMMGKLEGSANTFGVSVDFAKEQFKEFYKYMADDQMATNAVTNLMGISASTDTLAKIAEGATGVWASYGDSIPIESLTEAINETINVGKVTGTFADTINWAGISNQQFAAILGNGTNAQKAFNKAIAEGEAQEDAFNAALASTSDQSERANIIANFLNETYSESKKTYDELNDSILDANESSLNMKDTQAELGKAMEPVTTAFTDFKNKALLAMLPIVQSVSDGFMDMLGWLEEHPAVFEAVKATVLATAVAFGVLATALAIQGIINSVNKAMAALNVTMSFNAFVLIAAAIAGLVAALIYLWNTNEEFRNFIIGCWESVKQAFSDAINAIVNFFTVTIPQTWENFKTYMAEFGASIVQLFSDMWNGIINFFTVTIPAWIQNVISFFQQIPYYIGYMVGYVIAQFVQWGIDLWNFATKTIPEFIGKVVEWFASLPGKIWDWLVETIIKIDTWRQEMVDKAISAASNFVNGIITWIAELPEKIWNWLLNTIQEIEVWRKDLVNKGMEAAGNLVTSIVDGIKSLPSKMASIGSDLVEGLWNGINDMVGWIGNKIESFGQGVLDGIKGFFGIHSPSRVFRDEIGKMLPKGMMVGIEGQMPNLKKTMKNLGKKTMGYANKYIEPIKVGMTNTTSKLRSSLNSQMRALSGGTESAQTIKEINFNQYNNSPKALNRLEVYKQTKNLLFSAKARLEYV